MPQVQTIQYQPDANAEAIRSAGNQITESIDKSQQLALVRMDTALKIKNSQDEREKLSLQRKAVFLESMQKAIDQGIFKSPQMSESWIKMMSSNFPEFMQYMGETGKALQGFQSPQATLYEAQAESQKADAEKARAQAKESEMFTGMLQRGHGGVPAAAPGAEDASGDASAMTEEAVDGETSAAPRANAMQWRAMSRGPAGVQWEDLGASAQKQKMQTMMTKEAEDEIAMRPVKAAYSELLNLFTAGTTEIGGLGLTGTAAIWKGMEAMQKGRFGKAGKALAFDKQREPVALQIASFLNRGRPSDPDKDAVLKALPSYSLPKATNEALINYWNKVLKTSPSAVEGVKPLMTKMAAIVAADKRVIAQMQLDNPGISPEEIDANLRELHKTKGYGLTEE